MRCILWICLTAVAFATPAQLAAQLPGLNAGNVTATVDGNPWTARVNVATVDDEGVLVLTSLSNQVQIQVPNAKVGSFPIHLDEDGGLVDVIIGLRVGGTHVTPVSGNLVIDRLDIEEAAGRFEFTGQDIATEESVNVTDGQFEVTLIRPAAKP